MSVIALGTYLPVWGTAATRVTLPDEDAVTLAVAAGRAALAGSGVEVRAVVFVTRDQPLLEGGNGPALLAGLGVAPDTVVVERLGGAPAALDAVLASAPGTLVIGADAGTGTGCGAAAALVGEGEGLELALAAREQRSLPVRARSGDGAAHDYDDPRLTRERGTRAALDRSGVARKAVAAVGIGAKDAAALCEGSAPRVPTTGASAPLFALAALADTRASGLLLAFEQAALTAVDVTTRRAHVHRVERDPQPLPQQRATPGPEIRISLAAYDRAFDAKVRLQGGRCPHCGTLALPPRHRCLGCGAEGDAELAVLPRAATVYTATTVHTPVPGIATPYTIVIADLGDTGVRLLAQVTGALPGSVAIGDQGEMVLRRVAERSGVPDYGYAFLPDHRPVEAVR
ncbi:MAG TPA: Zn-ribbon domain-containing OB-fold protein [Acidimicrobiia bacterium]